MTNRPTESNLVEDRLEQCENALEDVFAQLWTMIVNGDLCRSGDLALDALEVKRQESYMALAQIVASTTENAPKRYVM